MRLFSASGDDLDDFALAELYAYPRARWLRANMVSSADGAAFLESRTAGLSSPTDIRLFGLLRALADVVLVGAGTVRTEQYKPARRRAALASLRAGRTATPPIALVSRALALDLETPLFTDAPPDARTIVITCTASPADRRAAVARVADLIVAGDPLVDLGEAVAALRDLGLGRVLCEGGPHLFGSLVDAGVLDELCLSLAAVLAGPGAGRLSAGPTWANGPRPLTLALVVEADSFLFCRYLAWTDVG